MKTEVKNPLIFAAGLAIGSVVTWYLTKEHYRTQAEEEIASVKEVWSKRYGETNKEALEKAIMATNKPDISVYAQVLQEAREREAAGQTMETEEESEVIEDEEPEDVEAIKQEFTRGTSNLYEITPSEFASFSNNRTRVTITRFADDVFADEMYNQVDPMTYLSGELVPLNDSTPVKALTYIRKMMQDEICIRNFDLDIDLDIVTEGRTYKEFMST